MPEPVVRVDGARQLRSTLRKAGADLRELRDVHEDVAGVVVSAAKPRTPHRSGRLAASVRGGATQSAAVVRAGYKRVPYALPIHWGWYRRGIKAQPWLSQAAQASEPTWFDRYAAGIDRILDKIKGA